MNDIVEINYPNLDSYFKELLLKQESSRKCYWSATKENLSDSLAFLGTILFLGFVISIFKITVDAETLPIELKVIPWLIIGLGAVAMFLAFLFFLYFLFEAIKVAILNTLEFKSFKNESEKKILKKIWKDFDRYVDVSCFEFDSRGFITGINKESSLLCQGLEKRLQDKLKTAS